MNVLNLQLHYRNSVHQNICNVENKAHINLGFNVLHYWFKLALASNIS